MTSVLPLLETGAAEAFSLSDAEISLACASHNSEARHIETVSALLERVGLTTDALECGPQISTNEQVKLETVRGGGEASRLRNNCSGKHAGFRTTAVHMGEHTCTPEWSKWAQCAQWAQMAPTGPMGPK